MLHKFFNHQRQRPYSILINLCLFSIHIIQNLALWIHNSKISKLTKRNSGKLTKRVQSSSIPTSMGLLDGQTYIGLAFTSRQHKDTIRYKIEINKNNISIRTIQQINKKYVASISQVSIDTEECIGWEYSMVGKSGSQ